MRIVEYDVELPWGYIITNDFAANNIKCTPGTWGNPGICMSIEDGCEISDVLKSVSEVDSPHGKSDFIDGLESILCGKDSDWKLIRVEACNAQVSLCCRKKIYLKSHTADCLLGSEGYADALSLSAYHKLRLRFEVPLPDGSRYSTTLIEASGDNENWLTVTELNPRSRKIWTFTGEYGKSNGEGRLADIVHVTECTW